MRLAAAASLLFVLASENAIASMASDAMDKGARLKAAGDDAGALTAYQDAVRADPSNALAHNELGTLLYQAGRATEAIAEFKRATECDPSYALAYYNYAFSSRKAGRFEEAAGAYQRYEQLKPDDPDAKFGLAESLRGLGRNAEAVAAYEAYIAQETRPSEQQWVEKAKATVQQLRAPAAAAQAASPTSLPVAPAAATAPAASPPANPVAAAIAAGDTALASRRPADAVRAYQDAVRGDPGNALAHFRLGVAYAELDVLDQAIAQWQEVLRLDPQNRGAADNIQRAQTKRAAARPPARAAPSVAPAAPPAAPDPATAERLARTDYEQAVGLISQRRYADSVLALNAAIQLQPNLAVAYVARGSAFIGLGRYAEAVQEYLTGLKLNGNLASPLFGLGEAYRGLGDRTHAAQYYQACAQSAAPDAAGVRDLARKRYADLVR